MTLLRVNAPTLMEGAGAIVARIEAQQRLVDYGRGRTDRLLEDFLWLHENGEIPWHLSRAERCRRAGHRLGVKWKTIERCLDRHGDPVPDMHAEAS